MEYEYELARLVVLVKKGILFERINKYDKPNSSKLVLKIKIGNKKYLNLVCSSRQWNLHGK